ncbi:23S rRNA pseudouridine1911/1915/1917 synthase [Parelusimicrobium proximum]|uniref:RluA family pseudouridine synthase n=1 Tax=Parelusimicrobium proximum TaxID=3228953 RepID=UPI003D17D648
MPTTNKQTLTFDEQVSKRLDVFIFENSDGYSRGLIQQLIKNGVVTVNGKLRKPAWPLQTGDKIEIIWPAKAASTNLKDIIIYEDKDIFVLSKPAGMLAHPQSPVWETNPDAVFASEETLVSLILANPPKGFEKDIYRAGLVHRLDKDTSGVMIVAKNSKIQDALIEMFTSREISKEYEAILCGELTEEKGTIDVPIGRVAGGKIKASELGREAVTQYKVKKIANGFTLAKLHPITGRTNQLRVHMSWLGYPVLGDWLYKGATARRLMLHSRRITFDHPFTGEKMTFTVPPPKDFTDTWKKISK